MTGMKMAFELTIQRGSGADEIYLEAGAAVTTFILAGRYFEARAKRRSGAALHALLELGAKEVVVLRDGGEERMSEQVRVPARTTPYRKGTLSWDYEVRAYRSVAFRHPRYRLVR